MHQGVRGSRASCRGWARGAGQRRSSSAAGQGQGLGFAPPSRSHPMGESNTRPVSQDHDAPGLAEIQEELVAHGVSSR